jgi:hypothetical protein
MADIYLLTGLALPQGVAHESLPGTATLFMSDCWPGMSRTPMMACAKRRGLRVSLCATARCPSGESGVARSPADQVVLTRRYRLSRGAPLAMLAAFNKSGVRKCAA